MVLIFALLGVFEYVLIHALNRFEGRVCDLFKRTPAQPDQPKETADASANEMNHSINPLGEEQSSVGGSTALLPFKTYEKLFDRYDPG